MPPRPIIQAEILANGDLKLIADAEAREWIKEEFERGRTSYDILWDGFEGYWNNSSFYPFDAGQGNPFVGLTAAPCIAEDMTIEDDGTRRINGRCWWFPNYAVEDEVETLRDTGAVIFPLGFAQKPETNFSEAPDA